MSDIAHNPAGLDEVAKRFKDLSEDATHIPRYWVEEALTRADAADQGLPGQVLPELHGLSGSVHRQSTALGDHILSVSDALTETAEMFRQNEEENVTRVKQIWSEVPQGDSQSGASGNPETALPSDEHLVAAPEAKGQPTWELALEIAQLGRDIQGEKILIQWLDELLGGLIGNNPTEEIIQFFSGDWKAIGEVAGVFENFAKYDDRMVQLMKRGSKETRTLGDWQGPSQDVAQDSINGNADRIDGLTEIWRDAQHKFEGWAAASYVLMEEIKALLMDAVELLADANKLLREFDDLMLTIADAGINILTSGNRLRQILAEALDIAVTIFGIFVKVAEKALYILQAFVVGGALVGTAGGSVELEREW